MEKVITITTDFGDQFAASQLHAVLTSHGFKGKIIENHSVTPFSIIEGAFQIQVISKFSPKNSIHVGVIDPGVGGPRDGIIIRTKKSWLVGPNNGLLYPAASEETMRSVWKINQKIFWGEVSNTFHGRDVFIKIAGIIAHGKKPKDLKCHPLPSSSLVKLTYKNGQVLHIDAYGNIKVNWNQKIIPGQKLFINNHPVSIVKTFSDSTDKKLIAYLGSHNTLEIAQNLGSANKILKTKPGEILDLRIV